MSSTNSKDKDKPSKRIEYRGKNVRVSRTGGVSATKTFSKLNSDKIFFVGRLKTNRKFDVINTDELLETEKDLGELNLLNSQRIHLYKDNKIDQWINAYQTDEDLNKEITEGKPTTIRQLYDVFKTPTFYLLDKDKKIVAKNLSIEQFNDFIQSTLKK